jgi:hypothetical protein
MTRKLVIIGSGAAGYTAGIYAARADLKPLLFEGSQPGGQLTITTEVENFPGFPQSVMGPELMVMMREQAARFGTDIVSERITKVDFSKRPFRLWDSDEKETQAEAVIVATGASAMLLGVPGEDTLMGYGVSACATCDAAFFRDVHVAVVGGGDSAMEEGNYLTKFAKKVTIIHRREEFRASKIMLHKAQHNPKVEFLLDTVSRRCCRRRTSAACVRSSCGTARAARSRRCPSTAPSSPSAQAQHGAVQGPARAGSQGLRLAEEPDPDQRRRRLRRRRRRGQLVPAGDHGRRHGLRGGARRGALARRALTSRRGGAHGERRRRDPPARESGHSRRCRTHPARRATPVRDVRRYRPSATTLAARRATATGVPPCVPPPHCCSVSRRPPRCSRP